MYTAKLVDMKIELESYDLRMLNCQPSKVNKT